MFGTLEHDVSCPYCGEQIVAIIDCSVESQRYIEDCEVCCRPIDFVVQIDSDGAAMVQVMRDNE